MLIIGIDPGMGVKSPTAIVAFDPHDKLIYDTALITRGGWEETDKAIKFIADTAGLQIKRMGAKKGDLVCFEYFVMKGKGGETLNRLIGALLAKIDYNIDITHVSNMVVKKIVGETGKASKLEVGQGVLKWFKDNPVSYLMIKKWIETQTWDVLDALAIGITGYEAKTKTT